MLKQQSIESYALPTEIDFSLAKKIRQQGDDFIKNFTGGECKIDFINVKHSKSVLISLILCWLRTATQLNKKISFVNVDQKIQDLIKVFNLQDLLNDHLTS